MESLTKISKKLKPIGFTEKVLSKIFKKPLLSTSDNCDYYDEWLCDFIDSGVTVTHVDLYTMTLKSKSGDEKTFWVENYPYGYGGIPYTSVMPNWRGILKLRNIQLSVKDRVINKYKNQH